MHVLVPSNNFNSKVAVRNFLWFPVDSFLNLTASKSCVNEIKAERFENDVLAFIKERGKTSLSEIIDNFDINVNETLLILDNLIKKNKIKANG